MTTLETARQIILKFKGNKIRPESLQPSASLTGDLNLDSLDFTELLVLAEDAFNIEIPLEEMNGLETLGDVVGYIDKRISAKSS